MGRKNVLTVLVRDQNGNTIGSVDLPIEGVVGGAEVMVNDAGDVVVVTVSKDYGSMEQEVAR